jgi:RHS repeat-associated protein
MTNPAGQQSTIAYDVSQDKATGVFRQVVTRTDPMGNQTITVLDPGDREVEYKTGKGNLWLERNYSYDGLGRIISTGEKHASGMVDTAFSYAFDPTGKTMKMGVGKPGNNQAITWLEYNGSGQLLKQTDPLGNVCMQTFTPWGGLGSYTNGRNQTLSYGYDAAGRFDRITLPGESQDIVHTLDGNGNRTETKVNGRNAVSRTFDNWNRLLQRTGSHQESVSYQYTPEDMVARLMYPDGKAVQYAYDNLARLTTVTDWAGRDTVYQYNPTGTVKEIAFPNTGSATYIYDNSDRLTGLEHKSGDFIIARINYTLDDLGNPVDSHVIYPLPPGLQAGSNAFTYNTADQLTKYNETDLTYDGDGNQTKVPSGNETNTAEYNIFNQLTGFGTDTFAYDPDGLRTDSNISGTDQSYIYDIGGYQSPWMEQADASFSVTGTELYYPAYGGIAYVPQLGGKKNSVPLNESMDRLLEVLDGQRTVKKRFVHGLGLISAEDARGELNVFHWDHLGNILAVTDAQGNIIDKYMFDPYGQITNRQGTSDNPFTFTGGYGVMDDGNGISYMRARSFSPQTARFIQKDFLFGRFGNPQSLNRYAYVMGNPVSFIDPLGLTGKDIAIGIGIGIGIGIVGGAVVGGIIGGIVGFFSGGGAAGAITGAIGGAIGGTVGGAVGGAIGGGIGGAVGGIGGGAVGGAIGGGTGGTVGGGIGGSMNSQILNFIRSSPRLINMFRWLFRGRNFYAVPETAIQLVTFSE